MDNVRYFGGSFFELDIGLLLTTSLFPFLDCRSREQARSAELLTDCCSEQGSPLSTMPFWNCRKPEESAGLFGEILVDRLQQSEGPMEHIANGAWEMLTDSMGNSCRLPANCSYKIFSFKRDHSSFIAPDSLAEFHQWVRSQMQKRDSRKAGKTVLKPSFWHSVNETRRWWWVVGVLINLMTLSGSLVLVNTLVPEVNTLENSKVLEFRRERVRESIESSGVAQWP